MCNEINKYLRVFVYCWLEDGLSGLPFAVHGVPTFLFFSPMVCCSVGEGRANLRSSLYILQSWYQHWTWDCHRWRESNVRKLGTLLQGIAKNHRW
jgi:hypothetical protein